MVSVADFYSTRFFPQHGQVTCSPPSYLSFAWLVDEWIQTMVEVKNGSCDRLSQSATCNSAWDSPGAYMSGDKALTDRPNEPPRGYYFILLLYSPFMGIPLQSDCPPYPSGSPKDLKREEILKFFCAGHKFLWVV